VTPKIYLATPFLGYVVSTYFLKSVTEMIRYSTKKGINIERYGSVERCAVHWARNALTEDFLKTDCTHIFWMDDDHVFNPEILEDFLEVDKDIVSAVYCEKRDRSLINTDMNDSYITEYSHGLTPVKVVGFGALLVKRIVFEQLKMPYFEYPEGNNWKVTEDVSFCIKALKAGYQPYIYGKHVIGHEAPPTAVYPFIKPSD